MHYVMLNNRPVPAGEALVPISDRGFRYGDGVFETIAVHRGVPYRFEWHMARLSGGLGAIHIPYDVALLQGPCLELLEMNGVGSGLLRIQITRGGGSGGYLPATSRPTVVIETMPEASVPDAPVSLWLSGYRRTPISSLPVHAKLCQGLNSTLARMEAAQHHCFDALQLSQEGMICETSSANIFWLKDDALHTPSLACGALEGSMRAALLELSPYPVRETEAGLDLLKTAKAVFITNAAWKLLAVGKLQPENISWDSAVVTNRLRQALIQDMERYAARHLAKWQKP